METNYEFYGRHLMLNFSGCEADMNDVLQIRADMIEAVNLVGANILSCMEHKFQPSGVSVLLLLSESHASIHTYPEYNACFLDIFTCGHMRVERFGDILEQLWQPKWVSKHLEERHDPALVAALSRR
jgi:S-adenosylmethionine decarboxylase